VTRRLLALAFVLGLLGPAARADVTARARGSATITGGDSAAARTRALDDAVRQAVDQTIAASLDPKARDAAAAEAIKKRVLRRARAYVPQLRVTSEGADEGVYAVEIEATVNDQQLAADLRALGVGVPPPVGTPVPDEPTGPPPRARPPLALLAVTRAGEQTWATFGRSGADGGPVAAALGRELGARGFKVARTAGLEVPVAPGGEGGAGAPLDVGQAQALARAAGAGGALVAAAELRDGGRIRGTRQVGAECRLTVRADDVNGGRLAEASADGAGFGLDAAAATAAAARDAAVRVGRELGRRLDARWPEETAAPAGRGVLVRLRGVLRWADVDALARALGAVPGVRQVLVSRYARREVALLVTGGASPRALADAAGQVALADQHIAARAGAGEVSVELTGSGRPAPAATEGQDR
jgi:hypothetical protein